MKEKRVGKKIFGTCGGKTLWYRDKSREGGVEAAHHQPPPPPWTPTRLPPSSAAPPTSATRSTTP